MTTYDAARTRHTDEVILAALRAALRDRVTVNKNLVDAFTAALFDAGVDLWALDDAFADADANALLVKED